MLHALNKMGTNDGKRNIVSEKPVSVSQSCKRAECVTLKTVTVATLISGDAVVEAETPLTAAHLALSRGVQQLEAGQPDAGLRVQVDLQAAGGFEPEQPLHPAHAAAEALGLPPAAAAAAATSAHRQGRPHLLLSRCGPTRLVRAPPRPLAPLCGRGWRHVTHYCFIPHLMVRVMLILKHCRYKE